MISAAQFCVTTYDGPEFGLNDVENTVTVLEIDSTGNIWFGLKDAWSNGVVGLFKDSQWITVSPSLLPDPRPNGIAFDLDDSVWVATPNGLGIIHIINQEGRQMTPANSGLPEAKVTAIAIDTDNNKWMGFNSGRVAKFDGATWEEFKDISIQAVNTIEIAKDSSVWAGFAGSPGLARYEEGSGFNTIPGFSSISAITADQWGRVLVACYDSMVIFSGPVTNIVRTAPGNVIRDIAIGSGTGIWASSVQGLLYRRDDKFLSFSDNNSSVPASLSYPIEFDNENNLWFGYNYLGATFSHSGTGFLYRTNQPAEAIVTADKANLEFCFGDSLTLTADPTGVSYVWPDGSTASNSYVLYDAAEVPVPIIIHCPTSTTVVNYFPGYLEPDLPWC